MSEEVDSRFATWRLVALGDALCLEESGGIGTAVLVGCHEAVPGLLKELARRWNAHEAIRTGVVAALRDADEAREQ